MLPQFIKLNFKPITGTNREDALSLRTAPSQEGFVESVSECLEEADKLKNWHPVGIYDGDLLIGFAMYGRFIFEYLPRGRVWLDRLLIDTKYQNMGYGTAVLPALKEYLFQTYHCHKLFLSVTPGNTVAAKLYERFGFCFNGEKDIHGEDVMVCKKLPA